MEVIPAIDIRGGRCVRLIGGDYSREVVFDEYPAAAATRWADAGAERIHIVDLDGALEGRRVNTEVIRSIIKAFHGRIQLGGGIRTSDEAAHILEMGVERVIFGTAAVETPDEVEEVIRRFGSERVVVSVDVKQGRVRTHGWLREEERLTPLGFMRNMADIGVNRFIYTDTKRDGELSHPDFAVVDEVLAEAAKAGWSIIIAGGVTTIDDIRRLAIAGAEGAISGMSLYTDTLDLRSAIEEALKHPL